MSYDTWHSYASPADINIPIFLGLYFGYKFWKKTHIWKPEDIGQSLDANVQAPTERDSIDFTTGVPSLEETEVPEVPPKNFLEKVGRALF